MPDEMENGVLLEFADPDSQLSVMFEDDGRVAYAYLLDQKKIVASVWLYNHGEAPEAPEWVDQNRAPFKNLRNYIVPTAIPPVSQATEIGIEWQPKPGRQPRALIYLRGMLHARLEYGAEPGWCILASKNGPLAQVFSG